MRFTSPHNRAALTRLRWRWAVLALACLGLLGASYAFLRSWWPVENAMRGLILAALVILYLLGMLWRSLPQNHRQGESELLPALGPGNSLTILRGVLIACLAAFLFSPRLEGWSAWIPGLLFTLAVFSDYLDGYLARASRHDTRLGETLDMSLDGLGVLVAALLAVQYGQVPAWYLLVALARYLYLAGLWLWKRLGRAEHPLSPSVRRRAFAGLQMGFIAVMLWPAFSPPGTYIAAGLFALPFLTGFAVDWLAATGIVRPARRSPNSLAGYLTRWTPLLLRLSAAALILGPLSTRFGNLPAQAASYTSHGLPFGAAGLVLLSLLEIAVSLFLLLGAAGRVVAILALILLGVNQIYAGLTPAQVGLAAVYTAILYLGTGRFSLWTPEDRLIFHRAGERRPTIVPLAAAPLRQTGNIKNPMTGEAVRPPHKDPVVELEGWLE